MGRRGRRSGEASGNLKRDERICTPHRRRIVRFGVVGAIALVVLAAVAVVRLADGGRGWPAELNGGSASGANVVLITLDTTRADRLGCYGYEGARTPNLDTLAARGIRFADAVSVVPVTLPSHATILTGLDPPQHGVRHNGEYRLEGDRVTLADRLAQAGYDTAAFVSAFVLDRRFGLDRGFALYDDDVTDEGAPVTDFTRPIHERSATTVTRRATAWLSDRDRSRPFFCWIHYFDPHAPRRPPSPFDTRFATRPYDGEIAYVDSEIGRLLDTLDKSGLREQTLIVVVADHGEGLGDHDEATHAKLIYESTMHVPLILSYPKRISRGHVVEDVVVSIADITPTVLDLLGISPPDRLDGMSLLTARFRHDRMIYMETLAPYLDSGWSPLYGIRRHRDKYILAPMPEYYDLQADPKESVNLYTATGSGVAAHRSFLVAELASRMGGTPSLAATAASARKLDPQARRRLEALGYVGSLAPPPDPEGQLPDPKEMMPVQHAMDEADGLAAAGRTDEALAIMRGVIAEFPQDPNALMKLGKIYLHQDRRAEAEEALRKAHAIRPDARVCVLLAQLMLAGFRAQEAATFLDQAEAADPLFGGLYLARGDLFALQRRPDEAIESYRRAQQVDPYRAAREAQTRIDKIREILRKIDQTPSPP